MNRLGKCALGVGLLCLLCAPLRRKNGRNEPKGLG